MRLDMVLEDHPELGDDEQFRKAQETVNRSIESLRGLMFELRPYVLDHDGLAAALAVFVQEEGKLPGAATYEVRSRLSSEPPDSVRVILYRITQEALVNVRKHARASHVEITLDESDDGYTVQVKDDGVGFEPAASSDPSLGHIGLTSMRERASLAGGVVPDREHHRRRHRRGGRDPAFGGWSGGVIGADRVTGMPIRTLIADDDAEVRGVLIDIIERAESLELVGVAEDAQQAIELAGRQRPDAALLDVKMPGGGPRAAREIRACSPGTAIIALSAHEDARSVQDMLAAGAYNFLVKGTSPQELVDAIRSSVDGQVRLSSKAASHVVGELASRLAQEREVDERRSLWEETDPGRPGRRRAGVRVPADRRARHRGARRFRGARPVRRGAGPQSRRLVRRGRRPGTRTRAGDRRGRGRDLVHRTSSLPTRSWR